MNTVTDGGVTMEVKAVIAIFDSSKRTLGFVLLPFRPTADEIAKLQADDTNWLLAKKSPDPKKWPKRSPYGHFQLSWRENESIGDAKKSNLYLKTEGINLMADRHISMPPANLTLTGVVTAGQKVSLVNKGFYISEKSKYNPQESRLDWNLNVTAEILPLKKK